MSDRVESESAWMVDFSPPIIEDHAKGTLASPEVTVPALRHLKGCPLALASFFGVLNEQLSEYRFTKDPTKRNTKVRTTTVSLVA